MVSGVKKGGMLGFQGTFLFFLFCSNSVNGNCIGYPTKRYGVEDLALDQRN